MRAGHYVKGSVSTTAPSAVVSLIVSPRAAGPETHKGSAPEVFRSAVAAWSRFRRGVWTAPAFVRFDDPHKVHAWLEGWAEPKRRTYVFAPIASNALTLTRFWDLLDERGARWDRTAGESKRSDESQSTTAQYRIGRLVLRGKPDILTYQRDSKSFVWLSGQQYFQSSEQSLAESIGHIWSPTDAPDVAPGCSTRQPWDRALLWLRLIQQLCNWWREKRGGPWGLTVGQLAERFWKSRLAPRAICTHNDEDALRLESEAIYGGRASVWFIGDVLGPAGSGAPRCPAPPRSEYDAEEGPLACLDVRSMYPWLLATRRYPVKLLSVKDNLTVKDLSELIPFCGVIASVRLRARHPEYPRRVNDRISYPCGEYNAVLCGPELECAIRGGEVYRVYRASIYQLGTPFAKFASELLALRQAARAADNPAWELFVKTLSNSFAGKLAQRHGVWLACPQVSAPAQWGQWIELDHSTGHITKYRSLAGLAQRYDDSDNTRTSTSACFSYLTSYGRVHMRMLRENLPTRSVLQQDTDGLWILTDRLPSEFLSDAQIADTPGSLRIARRSQSARFFDAKHYYTSEGWTLAGLHDFALTSHALQFTDTYTTNEIHGSPNRAPVGIWTHRRAVQLSCLPTDGTVGPSGWVDSLLVRA